MKTKYIYVDWLEPPKIQNIITKNVNAPIFKDFPPYKKHTYVGQTLRQRYYFVKYVLPENNSCDNLCEQVTFLYDKYGYDYKITEKDIDCPKSTVKKSKSFSWIEAFLLCRSINATLPEFYSRKEQEEFIAVIKSAKVFPIANMYIGLYKQAKVGVSCFIGTS